MLADWSSADSAFRELTSIARRAGETEYRIAMGIQQELAEIERNVKRRTGSEQRAAEEVQIAAERGLLGYTPVLPGFVLKQASTKVGDSWVKQTKAPGAVFEVPEGHTTKGVSALVDADGRVIQQWVKTKNEYDSAGALEALKAVFETYSGPIALPAFNPRALAPTDEPVFAALAMEWGYAGVGIRPDGVQPIEGRVL